MRNVVSSYDYSTPFNNQSYVEVLNNGAFSAVFDVQYFYNGQYFTISSGLFSQGMTKRLVVPENSTNVFVLVRIANGLAQFTPVYNYNFNQNRNLKLEIQGDIFSQYVTDVTGDPSLPPTTPPKHFIYVQNSGGYMARFSVKYTFGGRQYEIDSQNFSVGMVRTIMLPDEAKNIFMLVEFYNGLNWITMYNNNFPSALIWKMKLFGTVLSPQYVILPPEPGLGDGVQSKIMAVQYSEESEAYVGSVVVVISCISNMGNVAASKVSLIGKIPEESMFVPGSLTIDDEAMNDMAFPTNGIQLGDIKAGDTKVVTYQICPNARSLTNILEEPVVNCVMGDENDGKIISFTGTTTELMVKGTNQCNCQCQCCCKKMCGYRC